MLETDRWGNFILTVRRRCKMNAVAVGNDSIFRRFAEVLGEHGELRRDGQSRIPIAVGIVDSGVDDVPPRHERGARG